MSDTTTPQRVGFFQDSPNTFSATRLIVIIGFIWLFAIVSFIIYLKAFHKLDISWAELSGLFGTVATILAGLKLVQNQQENKAP